MAFFLGKSGADAVAGSLHHICKVLAKYQVKLLEAVDAALASGLITSDQALAARAFINSANATCDIFRIVASNSGFTHG